MVILLGGAPIAQLPPIGKIRQSSLEDLQAALCYLSSLYNPEVRPNRHRYRRSSASSCPSTARRRGSSEAAQKPQFDLDAIRADSFERTYATRWLTALVSRADQLDIYANDTDAIDSAESVVQQAASLLAICAGTASAGTRSRTFAFDVDRTDAPGPIRVELTDLPLDNQDYTSLGAQTWGGACLMADLIVQNPSAFAIGGPTPGRPLRVLELGAGTGLVGLAAGKVLETHRTRAEVIMTDFHPAVLENLRNNAATNFSGAENAVRVSVHPLDWSEVASSSSQQLSSPFHQPFDVVLGADIIYELEHARWIKRCVEKLLRVPPEESLSLDILASPSPVPLNPEFHLVMPLRSTHAAESQTVEQLFPAASAVRGGTDSPPEGGLVEKTLAIVAKEVVACEDFARGSDSEVEYVHFTIAWV